MKTKQLILIETIKRPIVIENNFNLTDSKQSLQLRRKTHAQKKTEIILPCVNAC